MAEVWGRPCALSRGCRAATFGGHRARPQLAAEKLPLVGETHRAVVGAPGPAERARRGWPAAGSAAPPGRSPDGRWTAGSWRRCRRPSAAQRHLDDRAAGVVRPARRRGEIERADALDLAPPGVQVRSQIGGAGVGTDPLPGLGITAQHQFRGVAAPVAWRIAGSACAPAPWRRLAARPGRTRRSPAAAPAWRRCAHRRSFRRRCPLFEAAQQALRSGARRGLRGCRSGACAYCRSRSACAAPGRWPDRCGALRADRRTPAALPCRARVPPAWPPAPKLSPRITMPCAIRGQEQHRHQPLAHRGPAFAQPGQPSGASVAAGAAAGFTARGGTRPD